MIPLIIETKGTCMYPHLNMCFHVCILAVERADAIARQADLVAALSLEVLKGTTKAFDSGMY